MEVAASLRNIERLAVACLLVILAGLLPPSFALADAGADARTLFVEGVKASREERWQDAREAFKQSAALVPKATTLINLAVVEANLGLDEEALATIAAFERLATPAEHAEALERAESLKQTLRARVTKAGTTLPPELHEVRSLQGEAAAIFEAGRQAYWSGRYEQALKYFEDAYELSKQPELLYDIGAAADRLRKDERALQALEAFLAASPESPLANAVRARVEVLKGVIAQRNVPPPPVVNVVDDEKVPPPIDPMIAVKERRARRLIWTGVAVEAAALGCLGYFIDRQRARNSCGDDGQKCRNTDDIDWQRRLGLSSFVITATLGASLIVPGVVLHKKTKQRRTELSAAADDKGGFASLRMHF